jgi:dephospho-CoA kinase
MADPPPPIIGLAGGVGAGKSAVAGILKRLGCVVADADEMARQALREPAIRTRLVGWWGREVLDEAGEIDRAAVARIVFGRPEELKRLESLVHPWVETRRKALFEQAPADACALVIDAPLLFEAGLDEACDAVIFVETDRPRRLARLRETRGWDEQELTKREESQLALDEKRARSDYVVINNGDLHALAEQVRRTLNEIVRTPRR